MTILCNYCLSVNGLCKKQFLSNADLLKHLYEKNSGANIKLFRNTLILLPCNESIYYNSIYEMIDIRTIQSLKFWYGLKICEMCLAYFIKVILAIAF